MNFEFSEKTPSHDRGREGRLQLVDECKKFLDLKFKLDGYNVGWYYFSKNIDAFLVLC